MSSSVTGPGLKKREYIHIISLEESTQESIILRKCLYAGFPPLQEKIISVNLTGSLSLLFPNFFLACISLMFERFLIQQEK